jgi:predicted metal-binding protein
MPSVYKRPATVAVSAADGYTFVFGDLEPQARLPPSRRSCNPIAAWITACVPWIERPELLRSRLVARIPAVAWSPADGHPPA